jgi:DNA-binding transcriptional MerR regulator/quercetin dioxygenase-like cupin family protein
MHSQKREEESQEEQATADMLYPIGEVARLLGVSRSLLRLWEREGLISPQRTPGGHRFYTDEDVLRLRRIAHLRRVDHLNTAGIRREIGHEEPATTTAPSESRSELGPRLRALRNQQGLSLAAAAERSGLSTSFLSAVERGQASISLANLFKLADAYGTTVPGLRSTRPQSGKVVRSAERPRFIDQPGLVIIEDLITRPGALEAQHIEILPGGGSEEAYAHPGEEFIYVLSGQLEFWIDEHEHYSLRAGDALCLPSTQLHRWHNESSSPALVLWMNVPLVEQPPLKATSRHTARQRSPLHF